MSVAARSCPSSACWRSDDDRRTMKRLALIALFLIAGMLAASLADELPSPDQMWGQILQLQRSTSGRQPVSNADRAALLGQLNSLIETADTFWQRHPDNTRVWEAKMILLQTRLDRGKLENKPADLRSVEADVRDITGATTAPLTVRAEAAYTLIELRAAILLDKPDSSQLAALDAEVAALIEHYPQTQQAIQAPWLRLSVYEKVNRARAEALLKEMANDKNPQVAHEANRRLKAQELTKKPLELKFTTVDGKAFDLAKLRGKVVLVDFWATWCGPCRMEIPHVVNIYKKLHEKGFEIVGISLDSSKDKLVAYAKEKEMTWPQYFDGLTWNNKISSSYGISGIPTMWLVDKKGFVRNTEARADLENQVNKLLTE